MSVGGPGLRLWCNALPTLKSSLVEFRLIKHRHSSSLGSSSYGKSFRLAEVSSKARPQLRPRLLSSSFNWPLTCGSNTQHRQFWTRRKVIEPEAKEKEVTSNASVVESQPPPSPPPPRIAFYPSFADQPHRANSFNELPDLEVAWKVLSTPESNAEKGNSAGSNEAGAWLDVTRPTRAEIELLGRKLGLHRLTVEDILGKETQEKVEVHANYSFISYSAFDYDQHSPTYLAPVNVFILTFPHGVLSLRSRHLNSDMEDRLDRLKESIVITPDWITYALIDEVTDSFIPALQPIRVLIEGLSDTNGKDPAEMLKTTAIPRKKVQTLRRLLGAKVEVVKALIKRSNQSPGMPHSEMSLNLSDVGDHLVAAAQELNHMEETISHCESNCLMQLNLQMTKANNDASEGISKLTILSTIILPLNVITGLWGMNVMVPGQNVESLHWFGGLASVMVVVACSGYLWATRFLRPRRKR